MMLGVPLFLSLIGNQNYALLKHILAPDKPKNKSLEDVSKTLKEHFQSKKTVIAEGSHFYCRN